MRHTLDGNMSAERFFDDLARTLAEPMPRRRAVRVIGASLAAITVPGLRPRMAHAVPSACSRRSPNVNVCEKDRYPQAAELYCCPPPGPRYGCGDADNGYKCKDRCPPVNPIMIGGKVINQVFCVSTERAPPDSNTPGWPVRYACCPRPDFICGDGECTLNCKYHFGPSSEQCGKECCNPLAGQTCKNGRCVQCSNTCKPTHGPAKCCERGSGAAQTTRPLPAVARSRRAMPRTSRRRPASAPRARSVARTAASRTRARSAARGSGAARRERPASRRGAARETRSARTHVAAKTSSACGRRPSSPTGIFSIRSGARASGVARLLIAPARSAAERATSPTGRRPGA